MVFEDFSQAEEPMCAMKIIIFYIFFEVYFRSPFGTDSGPFWEPILCHFGLLFSIKKLMEKMRVLAGTNLIEFGGIWWDFVESGWSAADAGPVGE